jgi:excisionase family DNA binding protein
MVVLMNTETRDTTGRLRTHCGHRLTLPLGKLALDGRDPSGEVSHLRVQVTAAVNGSPAVRCPIRPHVRALALTGHDQGSLLQLGVGALHGSNGNAVLVGGRMVNRQLVAGSVPAFLDGKAERFGDLEIRRARIVRVQLVHGDESTAARQLGHLGEPSLAMLSISPTLSSVSSVPLRTPEAGSPGGAGTPAGAHIETLGASMQFEGNRMYRVKAVAETLDVSVNTIYRAIDTGLLDALKIGGAVRIPGSALHTYLENCTQSSYEAVAAAQREAEADGRACVVCGVGFIRSGNSHAPVGRSEAGTQVFACVGRCEQRAASEQAGEVA